MNKFAVVDLETTGGLTQRDKITEIGIVLIDDGKIVDTFQTLVNPERSIPEFVSGITGIHNEMVSDAPKFYEIAKEVVLLTEGRIFVAHNVNFDYGFLRQEFEQLGFNYSRKKICTVKLAKKLYPNLPSHGLSHLIEAFNLPINNRHRALDDARATAILFLKMLQKDTKMYEINKLVNYGLQVTQIPKNIDINLLHSLPETSGVYFFEDQDGRYLYIGKSKNIRKRVMQHFKKTSKKIEKLHQFTYHIRFEETPGELIALLKEDEYIKKYKPPINIAQRKNHFPYSVIKLWDDKGIYFKLEKLSAKAKMKHNVLSEFSSQISAQHMINEVCKTYNLCECQLFRNENPNCWKSQLKICNDTHEKGADIFETQLNSYFNEDFLITEQYTANEIGAIWIENGICRAYGKLENSATYQSIEDIKDALTPFNGTSYSNKIIKRELQKKKANIKIKKLHSIRNEA